MLSMILFVVRSLEYTMTDPKTCKFSFFSDGQAMIKSLAEMRQWPYYYPNATLAPDWDVLQAIKRCLEQLDSSTMLTQVKGHQDDDTNFADLPLQAQLNVKADAAAGAYQYHDKDHQRTTLVDGAGVLLHSPDGTTGSNHLRRIRSARKTIAITDHTQTKNEWTQELFTLVDWDLHGRSVRQHFKERQFVCKLVHQHLPLGKLCHQYPKGCPSCDCPDEDTLHFFQCPMKTITQNQNSTQREIVAIYSTRTEVMPRDRACFYPSTDTHFTHETTSRQLRQWINTWQPLILHSIKEARRTSTRLNSLITDFFPRQPH